MATLEDEIPFSSSEETASEDETSEVIKTLPGDMPDIYLDETQKKELISWLTEEIDAALRDRQELEDEWKEIQELYEATEIEEKKDFPFVGAATIMIPVIATSVEEVWAWLMGVIFAPKDIFNVEPKRAPFLDSKDAIKKFITWCVKEELDLESVCSQLFMEYAKFGSMVAKTIYTEEVRTLRLYNSATRKFEKVRETIRHSPETIRVPCKDFIFPGESRSMEDARWKAHRFRLSWSKVLERRDDGRFEKPAIDDIRNFYTTKKDHVESDRDLSTGTSTAHLKEHEFFEVWFEYALKTDAEDQETTDEEMVRLVATFHKDSGTLMRIQHNWYPLQLDPFSFAPLITREGMLWGIGVGRMAVPTQLEVSAMHCQRLDNQTILNCVAFKYKVDSNLNPNLRLTPGRGIPMDDPVNDLIPLTLGQKFDSTLQEEEHTLKFLRDRLGIGKEVELGETSTNAIIRAQEARTKSNAILKNVRRFLTDIIEKNILLYQMFYPDGKIEAVLGADGAAVEALFMESPISLYYGMGVSVTAVNSAVSKDLERQNKLSLFNLLVQYYQQAMTYLQPMLAPNAPPEIKQTATEIFDGLGAYVRELLDDFDIPGRDKLVLKFEAIANAAIAGRIPPGGEVNAEQPGMENPSILPAA